MLVTLMRYALGLTAIWMLAVLVIPMPVAGRIEDIPRLGAAAADSTDASPSGGRTADADGPVVYAKRYGITNILPEPRDLDVLAELPIHEFSPRDLDVYLTDLARTELNPFRRIVLLARKHVGQPYRDQPIGEYPFEVFDTDPMVELQYSDRRSFVEQTLAMALAHNWPSFVKLLQRIRYKDGEISLFSRNWEILTEWNRHNEWLWRDMTMLLGKGEQWAEMEFIWSPQDYFAKYRVTKYRPAVRTTGAYIPRDRVGNVLSELRDADLVNVITGGDRIQEASGLGIICLSEDEQVQIVYNDGRKVIEEPVVTFLQGHPKVRGLRFLRLLSNPEGIVAAEMHSTRVGPPLSTLKMGLISE